MLFLDNICTYIQVTKGLLQTCPQDTTKLLCSINSNFGEYSQDFQCFNFQMNINLYLYPQSYILSKGTYGELKSFIKPFTMLETFSNVQNSYQKILQKFSFHESRSIERNRASIEGFFRSIEQESNTDQIKPRLQDIIPRYFD